jgi:hypothetical protein
MLEIEGNVLDGESSNPPKKDLREMRLKYFLNKGEADKE